MSNFLTRIKENNHNMPKRYGDNEDFDNFVDDFFGNWFAPQVMPAMKSFKNLEPKIEVSETDNDVSVVAEIPGMNEKDIDLEISNDGYLTISGEKKNERKENNKGNYFSEISYGTFKRTIPLPTDLKFDDAKADFENGVLSISIPKSKESKANSKKIEIRKK